jgi:hypothetical protein
LIPQTSDNFSIKTIFVFVSGGSWLDPWRLFTDSSTIPQDAIFLCDGRKNAIFAQLAYKGIGSGYGLREQLNDSVGAVKDFVNLFPNAELYIYGFSAGFNIWMNTFIELSIPQQIRFKGFSFGSPAPDPSSENFNWLISPDEGREFSNSIRMENKEISQKVRIILFRGFLDELITEKDFKTLRSVMDSKVFMKVIIYPDYSHTIPWAPVVEQLKEIEFLNSRPEY